MPKPLISLEKIRRWAYLSLRPLALAASAFWIVLLALAASNYIRLLKAQQSGSPVPQDLSPVVTREALSILLLITMGILFAWGVHLRPKK